MLQKMQIEYDSIVYDCTYEVMWRVYNNLDNDLSVRWVFNDGSWGWEVMEPEIRQEMTDIANLYLQLKSCCE